MAQIGVAVLVGLAFSGMGWPSMVAATASAMLVAVGNALMAARTFSSVGGAGMAMGGMLVGMALKWIVLIGGLLVVLGIYRLPPLPVLAGLAAAYAVNLLAFRFKG